MKRHLYAAVLAAILAILCLAGLAVFIFVEHRQLQTSAGEIVNPFESDEGLAAALRGNRPVYEENTERESTEEDGSLDSHVSKAFEAARSQVQENRPHRILFVGDSRTLGCRDAFGTSPRKDDCLFVGKVGEGCAWFREEGLQEMEDAIRENPDLPVVLNFGVNDPDQISQYLETYAEMMDQLPDTDFYFLSVNPVEEEQMAEEVLELINNENISLLNEALKKAWPDRYLDSSSMLLKDGFETVDGIHFTEKTYLLIHDFVVRQLF